MKFSKAQFRLTLLMLFSGFFSAAWAQDDRGGSPSIKDEMSAPSNELIRSRNYAGGFFSYTGIDNGGDIDGTGVEQASNPYELNLVPGINNGFGFGAFLGHREGAYALEASYWQSQHTAYWAPGTAFAGTGVATYQSIDINLKGYLFTEQFIQPFFQVGAAFPWLTYPLASTDGQGNFSSFSISGIGLDAGGGIELYFDHGFSILGGVVQRWAKFNSGAGYQKTNHSLSLEGDGLNFYVGGTMGVW